MEKAKCRRLESNETIFVWTDWGESDRLPGCDVDVVGGGNKKRSKISYRFALR